MTEIDTMLSQILSERLGGVEPIEASFVGGERVPWSQSLVDQVAGVIARVLRDGGSVDEPLDVDDGDAFISAGIEQGRDTVVVNMRFRPNHPFDPMPIVIEVVRESSDG